MNEIIITLKAQVVKTLEKFILGVGLVRHLIMTDGRVIEIVDNKTERRRYGLCGGAQ